MALEQDLPNNPIDVKIDRYFSGEMTEREIAQFRDELSRNPVMQKLVDAEEVISRVSARSVELAGATSQPSPKLVVLLDTPIKRSSRKPFYWMIGALLVIGVFIALYPKPKQTITPTPVAHQAVLVSTPDTLSKQPEAGATPPVPSTATPKRSHVTSDPDIEINKPKIFIKN